MGKNKKLCLVCSSGGHFLTFYCLKEFWEGVTHFWVTFPKSDTKSILQGEDVYWAYHPTNRNLKNFLKNIILAFRILTKEKPAFVISTGAGVGVSFIYMAKLLRIRTVYLELFTRVETLSLSGRLVYPVVDHLLVQWPELAEKYKKAKFVGRVI